jgi:transcriptional regulator with XRE-family HTH domain
MGDDKKLEPPGGMDIGARVRLFRKHLGLKQKELAEVLGISYQSLSDIEKGRNKPNFEFIFKLATRYNINLDYLIKGEGDFFTAGHGENTLMGKYGHVELDEDTKMLFTYYFGSNFARYRILSHVEQLLYQNKDIIMLQMSGDTVGKKAEDDKSGSLPVLDDARLRENRSDLK